MSDMILYEDYTIRTSHPNLYQELVDNKEFFKRSIHLFTTALAIGVILDKKSTGKTPHHDLIRLSTVRDKEQRILIDLLSRIACKGSDEKTRGKELLAYADGGLEKLWEDYQTLGNLDIPRLMEEMKGQCSQRVSDMLKSLEAAQTHDDR